MSTEHRDHLREQGRLQITRNFESFEPFDTEAVEQLVHYTEKAKEELENEEKHQEDNNQEEDQFEEPDATDAGTQGTGEGDDDNSDVSADTQSPAELREKAKEIAEEVVKLTGDDYKEYMEMLQEDNEVLYSIVVDEIQNIIDEANTNNTQPEGSSSE